MQKRFYKFKNTIIKFSIASMLLVIPLYPKFPFITIPNSQVSLRIEDFLLAAIFIFWLFANYKTIYSLTKKPIIRAILLFWLAGFISVLSGLFITQTVIWYVSLFHWARRIEYMLAFFIGLTSVKSKGDLSFYIKTIFVVQLLIFIYGLGQKYFYWPIISTQNAEYSKGIALRYVPGGHIPSTFAGHYDLSSYLILTLPLLVVLIFSSPKLLNQIFLFQTNREKVTVSRITNKIVIVRAFLFGLFLASLWLLVNAASRISIVSYLASVSLSLFFVNKKRFIPLITIISIIFVLFSSNLIVRYERIFDVLKDKISFSIVHEAYAASPLTPRVLAAIEDRSTSIRLSVEWPRAIRAFKKNPLLGTGYSSITLATDNDFLRLLGESGILGTIAFMLIFIEIFIIFINFYPPEKLDLDSIFALSIFSTVPGILLNMVFIDIMEASKFAIMFWLILGLSVSSLIKNNE